MPSIKSFSGLSGLLKQASKANAVNSGQTTDRTVVEAIKARSKRGKAKPVEAGIAVSPVIKAKPVEPVRIPVKSKRERMQEEKALVKSSGFADEIELILDMKIEEALARLNQRSDTSDNWLQVLTAKKVLENILRPSVQDRIKKILVVHAKKILLNVDGADEELRDIQAYNSFDLQPTSTERQGSQSARTMLAKIDECINADDLPGACEVISDLIDDKSIKTAARKSLVMLFNKIRTRVQKDYEDPEAAMLRTRKERVEESSEWKSIASDVALAVLSFEEHEEKNLDLSNLAVNLPITLYACRIVDGVPLVIDMEGSISEKQRRQYAVNHMVNYVSSYVGRLVGVPNINDPEKEYEKAKRYALKKEGIVLPNMPLRRPDSDAIWFPVVPFDNVYVRSIGFPDMISNREHATSEEYRLMRQTANSLKQRSLREAFEQSESLSFNRLNSMRNSLKDHKTTVLRNGEVLKEAFARSDVNEAAIIKHFDKRINHEVNGERNMLRRWYWINTYRTQQARFLDVWQERAVAQTEVARLTRAIDELEKELAERKKQAYPKGAARLAAG